MVSYVWLLLQALATCVLVGLTIVAVVTVIITIWQSQWRRRLKRFYDRKRWTCISCEYCRLEFRRTPRRNGICVNSVT